MNEDNHPQETMPFKTAAANNFAGGIAMGITYAALGNLTGLFNAASSADPWNPTVFLGTVVALGLALYTGNTVQSMLDKGKKVENSRSLKQRFRVALFGAVGVMLSVLATNMVLNDGSALSNKDSDAAFNEHITIDNNALASQSSKPFQLTLHS